VTRDEMLLGWLLAFRMNQDGIGVFKMPCGIPQELLERGWIEVYHEDVNAESKRLRCTPQGLATSDLAAPEYGIDPIPDYEASDG
jgi:hypothetical protein